MRPASYNVGVSTAHRQEESKYTIYIVFPFPIWLLTPVVNSGMHSHMQGSNMIADGPTNVCALTPVFALLVVRCFYVGRVLFCSVPTLTGLTSIGVSVVVSHDIKR